MAVRLNPYLNFKDDAREAMTFYQSVLGGELHLNTFGEFQASEDPAEQDKVMHSQLETPDGLVLMAADTPNTWSTALRRSLGLAERRRRGRASAATRRAFGGRRDGDAVGGGPLGRHVRHVRRPLRDEWMVNAAGQG